VIWIVMEHLLGKVAAAATLFALFAAPLGVGVVLERLAAGLGKSLRAERVALVLTPALSLVTVGLAITVYRSPTGAALSRVPARYAWAGGALGQVVGGIGRLIGSAPAQPAPSAPSSAAPTPEGRPAQHEPDAGPTDAPEPGAFASGDPSFREEPSCETLADVGDIERSYASGSRRAAAYAVAKARYPAGLPFLEAQGDRELDAWFTGAPDSFDGMASRFDVAVHEGAHIWSFKRFSTGTQTYPVHAGLTVHARRLRNFPRSEILSVHLNREADSYAKTYLEGASGAQGFNTLLDEYNAYAHSLASRYCTRDRVGASSNVSARDGILTFMYYVEAYLEIARTRHPADYQAIVSDSGHRMLIVAVWDRAELWLRRSAGDARLGIADRTIRGWVYDRARLEEIKRIRDMNAKK